MLQTVAPAFVPLWFVQLATLEAANVTASNLPMVDESQCRFWALVLAVCDQSSVLSQTYRVPNSCTSFCASLICTTSYPGSSLGAAKVIQLLFHPELMSVITYFEGNMGCRKEFIPMCIYKLIEIFEHEQAHREVLIAQLEVLIASGKAARGIGRRSPDPFSLVRGRGLGTRLVTTQPCLQAPPTGHRGLRMRLVPHNTGAGYCLVSN